MLSATPEDLSLIRTLMTLPFKGRSPVGWGRRLAWIRIHALGQSIFSLLVFGLFFIFNVLYLKLVFLDLRFLMFSDICVRLISISSLRKLVS